MKMDLRITNPSKVADFVALATAIYGTDSGIEIAEPPVVLRTATGALVMAWLPIENEDVLALSAGVAEAVRRDFVPYLVQ